MEVFVVSFLDIFAPLCAEARKEAKKSIKQTKITPADARCGNEPSVVLTSRH